MTLAAPGAIALQAVADAIKNVGVKEDGPPYANTGRSVGLYLASVGLDPGNPWCAAFVNYRLVAAAGEVGRNLPSYLPDRSTRGAAVTWANWAEQRGIWFTRADGRIPRRGDLVLFDIPSEHGIHHIGFVVDADETTIHTVEGNTHPDGVVTRDGYCVAARARPYSEIGPGGGFCRLPF